MCVIANHVNWHARFYRGQPLRRRHTLLPAFFAAEAAIEGTFGLRNVSQAAIVFGVNRPAVNNAHTLLLNGDQKLLDDVLNGITPLSKAAAKVRNRVKLIKTFTLASADDRAALGKMAGPEVMFDSTVMAAL